jgi:hypothetical protein
LFLVATAFASSPALAFQLPEICSEAQFASALSAELATATRTEPVAALRARVEKLIETEPNAAVAVMCATIPRVEREQGETSAEMAWWVGSLATPMIAFMDRLSEAVPLLDFARPILERRLGPYSAEVAEIHVAHAWIVRAGTQTLPRRGKAPCESASTIRGRTRSSCRKCSLDSGRRSRCYATSMARRRRSGARRRFSPRRARP